MANRLIDETSPYLLQHAHNPVDWYPWGEEALARARAEDKPILLSIGYAACHWCHVMERESFEDTEIARVMNELFVPVKVDREERPDLDAIYMTAVQAMTGHGGWPMTMFCTPEGRPFFGGTYYPPVDRQGMPSFRRVLRAAHDAWTQRREEVLRQSGEIVDVIARASAAPRAQEDPTEASLEQAARGMLQMHDSEWGGFGSGMKFPQPMNLEFLLRMHVRGFPGALDALTRTLDRMARGGIFDQIGGGFHRYSVDRMWLVPHFEKMLYDNAQLLRLYARAWQVTGAGLYRDTAIATAEYLLREMRHRDGGFFSSQDADSEGIEGKYYVWPYEEIAGITGDDMPLTEAAFALSAGGNWEGTNVLWRRQTDEEVCARTGARPEDLRAAITRASERLFTARANRIPPATDDKILASWNGLAIAALAEAGRIFGRADFVDAAERAATIILGALRTPDGRMHRSWRDGRTSGPGFLDDYAMMADACLTLYETRFEVRWYHEAMGLGRAMIDLFADLSGGFFDTGSDAETLVVRPKDNFDNALPSGNAAASDVLLRLAALEGDAALERTGSAFLRALAPAMATQPLGFGSALSALDRYLAGATEIAIVGDLSSPPARALIDTAQRRYLPNLVMAAGPEGAVEPALLRARSAPDHATAYVCRRFACREPANDPVMLESQLIGRS